MQVSTSSEVVDDIICAKQAASLIGCSTWSVYEYCKAGIIPHIRIGGLLRLRRSTITKLMAKREAESVKSVP
jgi:excisionase family DNA binding protein